MILFPLGIPITTSEHKSLLHIVNDPEKWLEDTLAEKVSRRKEALKAEWLPRLMADPDVENIPADEASLFRSIFARSDYQSRQVKEEALKAAGEHSSLTPGRPSRTLRGMGYTDMVTPAERNKARFNARNVVDGDHVLFPSGLYVDDLDVQCVQAYVMDVEDWVLGAMMGHANRGKKKMIAQYHPIIMADPSVTTIPGTEDGLVTMIVARSDYQRLGG